MTEEIPPPASSGDSSPSPFASRWFIASAGFVAALVVMGLVITTVQLVGDDSGGDTTQAQASAEGHEGGVGEEEYPQDPTASAAPGDDGSRSVCGLPPGEQTEFTGWPADTSWETVGLYEAPVSRVHGPGQTEDSGYRHCYARSPAGAVMAGMNYYAMAGDPILIREVAEHMLAEGKGRQAVLEGMESGRTGAEERVIGHIGGVKLLSYTGERARVDAALVIEDPELGDPEGAIIAATVDLVWQEGDWKVVTLDDGSMPISQAVIHSLDGYALTPAGQEG